MWLYDKILLLICLLNSVPIKHQKDVDQLVQYLMAFGISRQKLVGICG